MSIELLLLIIAIAVLFLIIFFISFKYFKARKKIEELYCERKLWLLDKSKLSLVEMKVRENKEGRNVFTCMRDIRCIISDDYIDFVEDPRLSEERSIDNEH